ncbi:MAG: hypothetical protein AAGJ74_06390 [Pseudomonadota bacterium]
MPQAVAEFTVTDSVLTPDLRPFTASAAFLGNGAQMVRGGGFEPIVIRTWFVATETAGDAVITGPKALTKNEVWREGAFDGAEIEVLRLEGGAFRRVRQGRVPEDGHRASGWWPVAEGRLVPRGSERFTYVWPAAYRSGARAWFTVRTVDRAGRLSAPATAVAADRPGPQGKRLRARPRNSLRPYERVAGTADLPAPNGLVAEARPDGTLALSWQPVRGAAGYVVYRSDTAPVEHRGFSLALAEPGEEVRAGDLVILRHTVFSGDGGQLLSDYAAGARGARALVGHRMIPGLSDEPGAGAWHLVPHTPETPVPEAGATHIRITLAADETLTLDMPNYAGADQAFYPVPLAGDTYVLEAWLRGERGAQAEVSVTGPLADGIATEPFRIGPEWRRFRADMEITRMPAGEDVGAIGLRLTGPGEIDIDNLRIYRADAPYLALVPEEAALLETSGMAALRTHGLIKTGEATYDLAQLTNPRGAIRTARGNTLHQTLAILSARGIDPWLQIEPHLSAEEWRGLAEYLAAPAGAGPWAAKRAAQGQVAPWTDVFGQITFEIGNETWNPLFAPWVFPALPDAETGTEANAGAVYGAYQEYVLAALRESPHWPTLEPLLRPVLGGRLVSDYGLEAARASPSSPLLAHAAYNGGWDIGDGPVRRTRQGFTSVLTHSVQAGAPRMAAILDGAEAVASARGAPLALGTYEAGPGYALVHRDGTRLSPDAARAQEEVMKSAAGGAATLDAFLGNAALGLTTQNYFLFQPGGRWASHAPRHRGGHAYPAWEALEMFNASGTGDMLDVIAERVPVSDLPELRRRPAVRDAPMVAAYATRAGDRLTVFLISRRLPDTSDDGTTEVQLTLPFTGAATLTQFAQSGRYDSHAVSGPDTRFERTTLPVPDTLPAFRPPPLPPGEAAIYVFHGVR